VLPKQNRLPLRNELNRVKKNGRIVSGRFFGLLLAQQPEAAVSRFGIICSNKIHRKAVKRNQIRRWLGEAMLRLLPKLKPGFDGVFLVKKNIVDQEFAQIETEVEKIFKKSGLLG
jgi:ribonuclease P protein component